MRTPGSGSSHYLGIDDGYFPKKFKGMKGRTVLAAVMTRHPSASVLCIEFTYITVDGLDATTAAAYLVDRCRTRAEPQLVFLDGVTYAGFNIIDPERLHLITGLPIAVIFWRPLNMEKVRKALANHFPDWRYRYGIIEGVYRRSTPLEHGQGSALRIASYGVSTAVARQAVASSRIYHPYPYPLKLADTVASSLSRYLIGDDENHRL